MRIYIDTSPIIYYIENTPALGAKVSARINAPGEVLVSSDLAWMETLVLPFQAGNTGLVQDFDDFFTVRVNEMVALSSQIFRNAATIRAQYGFKTPDAIHLAAAVDAHCDVFLTNDLQLRRFTGITVEVVT